MKKIMALTILTTLAIALTAIVYAYAPGDTVKGGANGGWAYAESGSVCLNNISAPKKIQKNP